MAGDGERERDESESTHEPSAPPEPTGDSAPEQVGVEGGTAYFGNMAGLTPGLGGLVAEEDVGQVSVHYAIKGLLFTLVGVVAILFPFVFGLAVEQLLAWLLVLGGGITLVQFMVVCGQPGAMSFLLLGALHLTVGLWLLLKPVEGLAALTFILTGWFLGHGILKLIMAFQLRHLTTWPAVLISGIISIALGIAIIVLTPIYGLQLVGIVFGADLLSTGVAVLLISLMAYLGEGHVREADVESNQEPLLQSEGPAAAPSA